MPGDHVLDQLVRGVRLLSLDAGGVVIHLDHERLAALSTEGGLPTSGPALIAAEGEAKRRLETHTMLEVAWPEASLPGARGWGKMIATTLEAAGVPPERLPPLLSFVWKSHVEKNLWSIVPEGFTRAMDQLRDAGIRVVLVSNSEGMLERLFRELGILASFDLLLDSGVVGLEKPDPRFFQLALDAYGVRAGAALHLGDTFATDVLGARRAGMLNALVDPHNHYAGLHLDVPRVPGVVEVAEALLASRAQDP